MSRRESIIITVKIPVWMVYEIEALVKMKRYNSRSDFIRAAIRELLRKETESIDKEMSIARKSRSIRVVDIDKKV
jgi:Arc/MetJ-type ribon-helix-helix transcriptional regulator